MPAPVDFPPARFREPGGVVLAVPAYERYEAAAETVLGAANTTLKTFSGRPDSIMLSCRGFSATFTLTDRLNRELDTITVPRETTYETYIRAERVLARNAEAPNNATASCVGKWAVRAEAGSGYD